MVILLIGASGFIGSRLSRALTAAGHVVMEAHRNAGGKPHSVQADFIRDLDVKDWLPRLAGVDAVINAAGILRERGEQTFEKIHMRAPQALFDACSAATVRRVVQISALGADTGATGYFSSKRAADEHLATLPLDWTIVQPALVFGPGGTSARLFILLASLPLIPVPGRGRQAIQPIHVDDLIESIVNLVTGAGDTPRRIALVGPQPLTLREFLRRLRATMGLRATSFFPVPMWLMRAGAGIAQLSGRSLLDRETLAMLESGHTADPATTRRLLGREPRAVEAFVEPAARAPTVYEARLQWLLPLLRLSIAAVWIWTAIVSFGLYPREMSYELLTRVGVTGPFAALLLYGAAALNLAFGLATLLLRRRRLLWLAQIAVILAYTIIITAKLPEFWLHPYGPVLKNLPMLACLYLLYSLESRWTTSS